MNYPLKNISAYLDKLNNTISESEKGCLRLFYQIRFAEKLIEIKNDQKDTIEKLIKEAVDIFDNEYKTGVSLDKAVNDAENVLMPLADYAKKFTIHYIGHAHIDMNWLWPWQETVDTTYKTFKTADKLMSEFDDFKFSQSQASVYKAMEDYSPETFEIMKKRIEEGKWEVTANTWVEGDKNLASGEAMVRQILYTKEYFKEKMNIPYDKIKIDWEPDTFGHAWTYPQILAKSGIGRYYFCRAGKGHRLFLWQAPDGSKVLAWNDEKLWYQGPINPGDVVEAVNFYKETGMYDYMISYGVGDHGGGPTRKHLNTLKEMEKWPVFPNVKFSTTDEFFTIAENYKDKLPVVNEELNFTFRGCYTSQSNIKYANRTAENMLNKSEAYAAAANIINGRKYPYGSLYKGWINTLFNQFHDILPGSGIHETYQYSQGLFQDTMAHTGIIKEDSLNAIVSDIDIKGEDMGIVVFNPLPWERCDDVTVKVFEKFNKDDMFELTDGAKSVPVNVKFENYYGFDYHKITFTAKNVPGLGYKTFYLHRKLQKCDIDGSYISYNGMNKKVIENEFLKVSIEAGIGAITSIIDKKTGNEYLMNGEKIGLLEVLHEDANTMSAWVIGQILKTEMIDNARVQIVENGPVAVTARIIRKYNQSDIITDITLYQGLPRIDFKMNIKWLEIGDSTNGGPLLKVSFAVDAIECKAKYEIPFGSIERSNDNGKDTVSNSSNNPSSLEVASEDVPAQKWVDLSGRDKSGKKKGLCIVNDCKYGFDTTGNVIRMSLVRSSYNPDPLPEVGTQTVNFAVYPHDTWDEADSAKCGMEFNNKMDTSYAEPHEGKLKDISGLLSIDDKIVSTSVKLSEDNNGAILRLYEPNGDEITADIKFNMNVKEAYLTDLLEQNLSRINIDGNSFSLTFKPFEIKTVRLVY